MNPQPVELMEGYFYVPGYPEVAVTVDGRCYDLAESSLLRECHYQYPAVNHSRYKTLHIHVLLALTFVPGRTQERWMVNHMDGNKYNFSIDNLEWTTPSENALHAYQTGLRNDNREVDIMDLRTKEVTRLYALQECARYFKVNGESIFRYLNSAKDYPYKRFFTMKYAEQEWNNVDAIVLDGNIPGQGIEVVATRDGVVRVYSSISLLALDLNLKASAVGYILRNLTNKKTSLKGWSFQYLKDFQGDLERARFVPTPPMAKRIIPVRTPYPVVVTDIETKETKKWDSIASFASSLGIKRDTLTKYFNKGNGTWKNYKLEYIKG